MRYKLKGRETEVAAAYKSGKSSTEVATEFEVSHTSVLTCLKKQKITPRTRSEANQKTECKRGHELSGENLYTSPKGQRGCLRCRSLKPRERKYGISPETFENKLALQKGYCEICNRPMVDPCVDHDHSTNEVRDLLCRDCNGALGLLHDDIDAAQKLVVYLKKWKS